VISQPLIRDSKQFRSIIGPHPPVGPIPGDPGWPGREPNPGGPFPGEPMPGEPGWPMPGEPGPDFPLPDETMPIAGPRDRVQEPPVRGSDDPPQPGRSPEIEDPDVDEDEDDRQPGPEDRQDPDVKFS
jgi:hypothetical protein